MHVVKIACERPDDVGRSLSQWDCTEIARRLVRDGVVKSIAAETVRQILLHHRLKPLVSTQRFSPQLLGGTGLAAVVPTCIGVGRTCRSEAVPAPNPLFPRACG